MMWTTLIQPGGFWLKKAKMWTTSDPTVYIYIYTYIHIVSSVSLPATSGSRACKREREREREREGVWIQSAKACRLWRQLRHISLMRATQHLHYSAKVALGARRLNVHAILFEQFRFSLWMLSLEIGFLHTSVKFYQTSKVPVLLPEDSFGSAFSSWRSCSDGARVLLCVWHKQELLRALIVENLEKPVWFISGEVLPGLRAHFRYFFLWGIAPQIAGWRNVGQPKTTKMSICICLLSSRAFLNRTF